MQPLHRELYTMHPTTFFVPSFLKAISDNTEQSFRNIISEPSPGVFTFEMLQPRFCELLLAEVENFEKWVNEAKFRIMRPNTMNKYGAVLDDFGLETMLDKLMESFIRPLSKVFFAEVGGSTLDSHHGFVVEYGKDRDVDLGFHVDDSEVTLNVCLGLELSIEVIDNDGEGCSCSCELTHEVEVQRCHPFRCFCLAVVRCKCLGGSYHWRSLTTLMSLDELYFIVVVTAMVLEPQHLVIGSIYSYGAEGMIFRISSLRLDVYSINQNLIMLPFGKHDFTCPWDALAYNIADILCISLVIGIWNSNPIAFWSPFVP
ncbi:hypothetical protein Pint_16935 [Pistacia integerrima]|uniref:Uncharacterized protein n=1 Tax=Pistacia integerrima TaxID=434235 RepID=A0ACC0ZGR5_9ROSI|nr:hypothetical protein Pint_16935 [Pistacia integerrima]